MKKKYLLIPVGLLFFNLLFLNISAYDSSKILFVFRHLSIFTILVFIIIYAQIFIKELILKKYTLSITRTKVVKVTIGFLGLLVIVVLSNFQINFINNYELPKIGACDYYDQYGHLIYASKGHNCPVINEYELNDDELNVVFEEIDDTQVPETLYRTNVTINYDEFNHIEYVEEYIVIVRDTSVDAYKFIQTLTYTENGFNINQTSYYQADDWEIIGTDTYIVSTEDGENGTKLVQVKLDDGSNVIDFYDAKFHINIDLLEVNYYIGTELSEETIRFMKHDTEYVDFDFDISISPDQIALDYGSVTYYKQNNLYYLNHYDLNLEYYLDPPFGYDFIGYSSLDMEVLNENTYKSNTKTFVVNNYYELTQVITYVNNTNIFTVSEDIDFITRNKNVFAYDYEKLTTDYTNYTDYLIYRINPLIDYTMDLLGGYYD